MLRRTTVRIAAVLAAILIVASCARTGADVQTRSAGQMGYPTVPRNLTRIPPEQRRELPIVSGPALSSHRTISSQDYRGKVVVINVWGSWCPPCRKEAPDLQAASVETRSRAENLERWGMGFLEESLSESFIR